MEQKVQQVKERRVVQEEETRQERMKKMTKWDEFRVRKEAIVNAYLDKKIPIKLKIRTHEWYKIIKSHWYIGIYLENVQRLIYEFKMHKFIKILMFLTHMLRYDE